MRETECRRKIWWDGVVKDIKISDLYQVAKLMVLQDQRRRRPKKRDLEKEMWTAGSGTAGGRWRRQHRTELDGDKWSVGVKCISK